MVVEAAAGGPGWTDVMTAFGTVGAAVGAVVIAAWSDWRVRRERRLSLEREQWAEASAVQVTDALVRAPVKKGADRGVCVASPAVLLVNRGRYGITWVDARFSDGKKVYEWEGRLRLPVFADLPEDLRRGAEPNPGMFATWGLLPGEPGLRIDGPAVAVAADVHSVVRWKDRWGTSWEQRRGIVRAIGDVEDPWEP